MNINQRVRFAINSSGKNIAELAKEMALTPPAVARYVNGTAKPKDDGLKKIADITGLSYDWLKDGSGKVPLGFKEFITSTGLTKEELLEKVQYLEDKVERLQKENKAQKREIELLERLTAKGRVEVP